MAAGREEMADNMADITVDGSRSTATESAEALTAYVNDSGMADTIIALRTIDSEIQLWLIFEVQKNLEGASFPQI